MAVKISYKIITIYLASQLEDISKNNLVRCRHRYINTINEKNMDSFTSK